MKKVITMVGTSIFNNYFANEKNKIFSYYEHLKEKRADCKQSEKARIERIKTVIKNWSNKMTDIEIASAEIKSLIKIKKELNEDLEVYLLCSDTILSFVAGEIIKEIIESKFSESFSVKEIKVIQKLQIWDEKEFNKGMANLINEIYDIADNYWENVIINITGGYKATIPYLTILAQLNKCPLYYIFENTDTLIKIPNIPLSTEWFNFDEIEPYEDILESLSKGIDNIGDYNRLIKSDFYKKYSFLIWEEEPFAELNPIGQIIYKKYKENIFEFYTFDEVISKIENDKTLEKHFKIHFSNTENRLNKTEKKKGHFVYDAGDNQIRIFYRESENKIYVYKVFTSHDKYEQYLNTTPFTEEISKKEFKKYKIIKTIKN